MQTVDLTHHFLIAMPGMVDPNFARTLTYICEHNEQGALGVVVNRPIDMNLGDLFDRVGLSLQDPALAAHPVYFGGPVQVDRGFVLHRPLGEWGSTLVVRDGVGFTTSKDILEAVAAGGGPGNLLVSLGYAGWAPGQIEEELLQNAWLTVAAEASVIFDLPSESRFDAAMRILGVNPASLSEAAGHA